MKHTDIIKFLDSDIDVLDLSVRSYNSLKRANIKTVGDLLALSESDIKIIRNLGNKGIEEVIEKTNSKISEYPGLKIGMTDSNIKDLGIPLFYFHEDIRASIAEILSLPVSELNLAPKAFNFLSRRCIRTIRQLVSIEDISSIADKSVTKKDISGITSQLAILANDYPDIHLGMDPQYLSSIPNIQSTEDTELLRYSTDNFFSCFKDLSEKEKIQLYHSLVIKRSAIQSELDAVNTKLDIVKADIERGAKCKKKTE